MAFPANTVLVPAVGQPVSPSREDSEPGLHISVVFTSLQGTIAALRHASALASRLSARITLVVPQIVPYPAQLETPPVLLGFSEQRFREIAKESSVDITVHFYLCRERRMALAIALKPGSLIVLGGRKRWWRTAEERLARELERGGHQVVFAAE